MRSPLVMRGTISSASGPMPSRAASPARTWPVWASESGEPRAPIRKRGAAIGAGLERERPACEAGLGINPVSFSEPGLSPRPRPEGPDAGTETLGHDTDGRENQRRHCCRRPVQSRPRRTEPGRWQAGLEQTFEILPTKDDAAVANIAWPGDAPLWGITVARKTAGRHAITDSKRLITIHYCN